jgi:23S rRNA pseudouridine1911/1915/1917 synthase
MTIIVPASADRSRLDVFLVGELGIPRARIQAHIKDGGVTRNGSPLTPHAAVREGDTLEVADVPETKAIKRGPAPTLDILYEDDDLLVINKPAGTLVHAAHATDRTPTIADAVLKHVPSVKGVGEPGRFGIVHRLDKDVSGVMLVAKTSEEFERLKRAFADRSIGKEYRALVYGKLPKDHDVITLRIARSKAKRRMVARPEGQEGKEAHTEYDVIERFKTTTLAKVVIKTGRTHQIRTHFRAIDHPVVGDKLYAKTRMKNIRPIPMTRLFLHARQLDVPMKDGTMRTFEAPIPAELTALLKTLPSR